MRAVVLRGPGDLRVEERPVPEAGPGEVLIKVAYSAICGSDLRVYDGLSFGPTFPHPAGPRVLGHEYSGTIVAFGPGLADGTIRARGAGLGTPQLAIGQHVAVEPWLPCGTCWFCRRGEPNLCAAKRMARSGSWAEYIAVPAAQVFPLPDRVPLDLAALAEPLACALRALDRAPLAPGAAVAITGAGGLGLLLLRLARHAGARLVVVSEPLAERRALAERLGADRTVDPGEQDPVAIARELADGVGVDVAFDASGAASAIQHCLAMVRDGGTVALVGVADPATSIPLSPFDVFARELTIVGSLSRRHTFARALAWLPTLGVEPIITHVFDLDRAPEAVQLARAGRGGKILIKSC